MDLNIRKMTNHPSAPVASAQTDYFASRKRKVPFSKAIGHGELMYECFQKHSSMETARTKYEKET